MVQLLLIRVHDAEAPSVHRDAIAVLARDTDRFVERSDHFPVVEKMSARGDRFVLPDRDPRGTVRGENGDDLTARGRPFVGIDGVVAVGVRHRLVPATVTGLIGCVY